MAILTPSLTRLRSDINTRCPSRDKTSDGWIGDQDHATRPSGHNPDETGIPESTDADHIDEVRAIDVDKDLREPGLTALQLVQAILADPAARNRLRYIIFNRVIWTKSNNWQPREYTGQNPHDQHIHFSGDVADDANAAAWTAVLEAGDMTITPEVLTAIAGAVWAKKISSPALGVVDRQAADWLKAATGVEEDLSEFTSEEEVRDAAELARDTADAVRDQSLADRMTAVEGALGVLLARPPVEAAPVDPVAISAAVAAALADPAVVAALVDAINDDAARRAAD